ncbi:holo-ACP synthase [Mycolicibacterium confluentis]|uniref:holo-ACP synthase n=1 Tax=Mycolicibacterium confluentis TaxID=28047 RepID=UPI0013D6E700|nr:holo-ACP synthase [Mycolicibacterium confluentis]MCV7319855.1 holo-ACP synthase [Mycolicibacterium confluentis]
MPGIDIVSVSRVEKLIRDGGEKFLSRWFTAAEVAYCTRKAVPSRHFAARLAAKEAVTKVLPSGWDGPLPWRSIEITNDIHGAPTVRLSGSSLAVATDAGIDTIRVSLSHCDEYATAVAMASYAARVADDES